MMYRVLVLLFSLSPLCIQTAQAHEFWVEPSAHVVTTGDTVEANLRVGQDYSGTTYPYLPRRLQRFDITDRNGTRAVDSVIGDIPAATLVDLSEGLNILSYVSTPDVLDFDDWELFKRYVVYEGNSWAIDAHEAAGLPKVGFSEAYTRHTKALVQVGATLLGSDIDRPLGLKFELVALRSPYALDAGKTNLPVQLLWNGTPMANQQINIFHRADPTVKEFVMTDTEGRALISVAANGRYLLNAVNMFLSDDDVEQEWESHWASLTFEIRGRP